MSSLMGHSTPDPSVAAAQGPPVPQRPQKRVSRFAPPPGPQNIVAQHHASPSHPHHQVAVGAPAAAAPVPSFPTVSVDAASALLLGSTTPVEVPTTLVPGSTPQAADESRELFVLLRFAAPAAADAAPAVAPPPLAAAAPAAVAAAAPLAAAVAAAAVGPAAVVAAATGVAAADDEDDAAGAVEDERNRQPVTLLCVLDRSGSMSDGNDPYVSKMNLVQDTMRFVVSELRAADSLAIASFAEDATTILPLSKVHEAGRAAAETAIAALHPGGGTAIAVGLAAGLAQAVGAGIAKGGLGCVLLTDGLDGGSELPRSQYGRYDAVIATARERHVPVFCLGFGKDHDAGVLAHIASSTGGTYAYVDDPSKISGAFSACLASLLTTVTRDMTLVLQVVPGDGAVTLQPTAAIEAPSLAAPLTAVPAVAAVPVLASPAVATSAAADPQPIQPITDARLRVGGAAAPAAAVAAIAAVAVEHPAVSDECRILSVLTSYPHAVTPNGASAAVQFGSMFAGERREVLIKLLVPALPNYMHAAQNTAVQQRLLTARLVYHDIATEAICASAPVAELVMPRYSMGSAALGRRTLSPEVDAAVNRELATAAMLQATQAAEGGNYPLARSTLEAAILKLSTSLSAEHATTKGLVADMRTALGRVRDRTAMESGGRAYMMSTVTSNQQQRFTGSDTPSASAAAYASVSQVRMTKKGATYSSAISSKPP